MKIQIDSDNQASKQLKAKLEYSGYVVSPTGDYVFSIETIVNDSLNMISIDGVDSTIERRMINHIAELSTRDILLRRSTGVRSDRALSIVTPIEEADSVVTALYRSIVDELRANREAPLEPASPTPPQSIVTFDDLARLEARLIASARPWYSRLWRMFTREF